jgi:hypothetical protein
MNICKELDRIRKLLIQRRGDKRLCFYGRVEYSNFERTMLTVSTNHVWERGVGTCKIILNIKTQNQLSIRDYGNSTFVSLCTPFNNVFWPQQILTLTLQIKLFVYVTVISSIAGNSIALYTNLHYIVWILRWGGNAMTCLEHKTYLLDWYTSTLVCNPILPNQPYDILNTFSSQHMAELFDRHRKESF